jgi:hypothetical protein
MLRWSAATEIARTQGFCNLCGPCGIDADAHNEGADRHRADHPAEGARYKRRRSLSAVHKGVFEVNRGRGSGLRRVPDLPDWSGKRWQGGNAQFVDAGTPRDHVGLLGLREEVWHARSGIVARGGARGRIWS